MIYEARGFRLARDTIQDNRRTNWPSLLQIGGTTKGVYRELGQHHITHVLFNRGSTFYYISRGQDSDDLQLERLDEFLGQSCVLLYQVGGLELYALKDRGWGNQ